MSTQVETVTARLTPRLTLCEQNRARRFPLLVRGEKGDVGPKTFTLRMMAQRIADVGDLWADLLRKKRSLKQPIERLKKLSEI